MTDPVIRDIMRNVRPKLDELSNGLNELLTYLQQEVHIRNISIPVPLANNQDDPSGTLMVGQHSIHLFFRGEWLFLTENVEEFYQLLLVDDYEDHSVGNLTFYKINGERVIVNIQSEFGLMNVYYLELLGAKYLLDMRNKDTSVSEPEVNDNES